MCSRTERNMFFRFCSGSPHHDPSRSVGPACLGHCLGQIVERTAVAGRPAGANPPLIEAHKWPWWCGDPGVDAHFGQVADRLDRPGGREPLLARVIHIDALGRQGTGDPGVQRALPGPDAVGQAGLGAHPHWLVADFVVGCAVFGPDVGLVAEIQQILEHLALGCVDRALCTDVGLFGVGDGLHR